MRSYHHSWFERQNVEIMVEAYSVYQLHCTRSPLRLPRPVHHAHPPPFTNLSLVPPSTPLLHATALLFLTARTAHIALSQLCLAACFMRITGEIRTTFWHVMAAREISYPAVVLVEGASVATLGGPNAWPVTNAGARPELRLAIIATTRCAGWPRGRSEALGTPAERPSPRGSPKSVRALRYRR